MLDSHFNFEEQRIEARRRQILLGAAKVFTEKGFHKATTKEVAQAAGVSEGTIYNYFDNKRELLLAMIELLATQSLKGIILQQPATDPKEFFTLILRDRYQLAQERGYLIAPIMAEIFTDTELRQELYQKVARPIAALLEQYIQARIDSGEFRQVDPVVATRAFVGAILVNFAMKLAELDPRYENVSADALIEELVSLFLGTLVKHEK